MAIVEKNAEVHGQARKAMSSSYWGRTKPNSKGGIGGGLGQDAEKSLKEGKGSHDQLTLLARALTVDMILCNCFLRG